MNPNNCNTCQHKKKPDGGWCYMFRDEPTEVCMQHTGRKPDFLDSHLVFIGVPDEVAERVKNRLRRDGL